MRVDKLRDSRTSIAVKLKDFLTLYGSRGNYVFCFTEGDDVKYYEVRVRLQAVPREAKFFSAGGKENVLHLRDLIAGRPEYKDATCLFFTDRDFDPPIADSRVFETPCYSIENLYTTEAAFIRIIESEFNITALDKEYSSIVTLFKTRQSEFHESVLLLNAWIACQRQLSREGKVSRVGLSGFDIKKVVGIELSRVTLNYSLATLEAEFPDAPKLDTASLEAMKTKLRSQTLQRSLRGKFEAEFLRTFLEKLKEDANKKAPTYFSEKRKCRLNISRDNFLSDLSQYAENPDVLSEYIKSRTKVPE